MAEPRLAHHLLAATAIAAGLGLLWWLAQPPEDRLTRLTRIAQQEGSRTRVPPGLLDQAEWLWQHRSGQFQGLLGLCGVAAVIGLVEGQAWRRWDRLAGFRQSLWTVGLCLLLLVPGLALGVVLAPWPLQPGWIAAGSAGWIGVACGLLGAGRPYTP